MEMRINLDCNACCRKMRRILHRMKGTALYTHATCVIHGDESIMRYVTRKYNIRNVSFLPLHFFEEIEDHSIEKQLHKVIVWGRFVPADVAIKIRKKMKRRVEILEIQELGHVNGHLDQMPPVLAQPV